MISLNPEFDVRFKALKKISKLLKHKELFDESKFIYFQAILELEIENFLTKEEQNEIKEVIKMTPEAMEVVTRAIKEVNNKVLAEAREEGFAEGRSEGWSEGETETTERIAKSLRDTVDLAELSKVTGLTIEEIKNL